MQAEEWIKYGNELGKEGKSREAANCYSEAIILESDNVLGWGNLGVMQERLGNNLEGVVSLKRCIALAPDYALAHYNLGMLLAKMDRMSEAVIYLEKAEKLNPSNVQYILNSAVASQRMGKTDQEIAGLEKVNDLRPDHPEIADRLWLAYRQLGRWDKLKNFDQKLVGSTEDVAFTSLVKSENPRENWEVAQRVASTYAVDNAFATYKKSGHKIRLGYFSADLREHPVGQMVAGMMDLHDKAKFEVVALSTSRDDGSHIRKNIAKSVDQFVDLSAPMSDSEMAKHIHDLHIDILIEMTGYTRDKRIAVCAYRPAKVQVEWLGFPGSTGAKFIDYAIVDKIVVPPSEQKYFSEKLLYLPRCYQVNTPQKVSSRKFSRAEWGLPESGFVFGSFNQQYKIEPVIWGVWMNILKRVPKCVLWLWSQQEECSDNLEAEAKRAGVDPERIIFAPMAPKDIHLARLRLTDLALDTLIYGGHTTTSDYLWAGVPVVTKLGTHFASRVGTSILTTAGIPEMITHTIQEYEDLAVELATNPSKLQKVKAKITQAKLRTNLFNTKKFVSELEDIYLRIAP